MGPRSWQYGQSTARSVHKRPWASIPQYGPEQVRLVSCLLYGMFVIFVFHRRTLNSNLLHVNSACYNCTVVMKKKIFFFILNFLCFAQLEFPVKREKYRNGQFHGYGPDYNQAITAAPFHLRIAFHAINMIITITLFKSPSLRS